MVAASIGVRPTYSAVAPRPIVFAAAMKRVSLWRDIRLSGNSPWLFAIELFNMVNTDG